MKEKFNDDEQRFLIILLFALTLNVFIVSFFLYLGHITPPNSFTAFERECSIEKCLERVGVRVK